MNQHARHTAATGLTIMALLAVYLMGAAPAFAADATQIAGGSVAAGPGACVDPEGAGADFALVMSGDLVGCHYAFVETAQCGPSGVYVEIGTELFVGEYEGVPGTFRTTYRVTAKYSDCPNLAYEKVGRCQHPITAGSGTGVFEGVTGRLDFKDDVVAGNFPYRGHLLW